MTVHWSRERPVIWAEAIYTFPLGRVWYVPAKPAEPCFRAVELVARPINVEFVAQPIKLEVISEPKSEVRK